MAWFFGLFVVLLDVPVLRLFGCLAILLGVQFLQFFPQLLGVRFFGCLQLLGVRFSTVLQLLGVQFLFLAILLGVQFFFSSCSSSHSYWVSGSSGVRFCGPGYFIGCPVLRFLLGSWCGSSVLTVLGNQGSKWGY
jgi:hypothetical protein